MTNFSNWLFGTNHTMNINYKTNGQDEFTHNIIPNETKLPKLPVPNLQHTLCRYLEALEPILSESQFNHTKSIVEQFGAENGSGEKLQQLILKRQEIYDNWAYNWWLDDMYLNNQAALPINSNPGMVWPPRNFSSLLDMAKFAARIVSSALICKNRIDKNELTIDTVKSDGKIQPLCMAQYGRIFTSYRAPGIPKDTLLKSETEYTKARPHIVVACKEYFYVVFLTKGKNAETLTENEIASQLFYILNENINQPKNKLPIGILTGLKRDSWAIIREQLLKDETNQRSMSFIEKSLFIICFDLEELELSFNSNCRVDSGGHRIAERDETNMAHQMLHGGGSFVNSGNRWFDKTTQIIIGSDGANGLCYEHSPAEGIAIINIMETILNSCQNVENIIVETHLSIIPQKLTWVLNSDLEKQIYSSKEQFDKNIKDLDFYVFRFNEYGKNFIKSCNCSPDAYIQLALQLTYYKIYTKLCATYESASTRRFLLGRVDCIRAATLEALRWVAAMQTDFFQKHDVYSTSTFLNNSEVSIEKKLELFDKAIQKQTLIATENISGYGIDVHLLGLKQTAKDCLMCVDIFEDEAYSIANQFLLSTSQVTTGMNSFMGYGPVVPHGYGASYNLKDDYIIFCISSFYSSEITNTKKFTEFLRESLNSTRDLLVHRK